MERDAGRLAEPCPGGTRGGQEDQGRDEAASSLQEFASLGDRSSIFSTPEIPSAGGEFPDVPCGRRTWDFWVSPRFVVLANLGIRIARCFSLTCYLLPHADTA